MIVLEVKNMWDFQVILSFGSNGPVFVYTFKDEGRKNELQL